MQKSIIKSRKKKMQKRRQRNDIQIRIHSYRHTRKPYFKQGANKKVVKEFYEKSYRNTNELVAKTAELSIDRVRNPESREEYILYTFTKIKHNEAIGEDYATIKTKKLERGTC